MQLIRFILDKINNLGVLEYLVTLEIAKQKQAENKVTVDDKDIQTQIDQIKAMFSNDETAFANALKQQNLTLDSLKQNLEEQTLLNKSVDVVTKDATTTAAQVQSYYEAHKADYVTGETRTARHILFAPKVDTSTASSNASSTAQPTQADWDKAKALAERVRAEIVAGADFAAEAKKYSDDPGTKDNGGELGAVPKGEMVKEFDDVLFSLKKGEISQPVKTQYGYHLIQVTEITPAKQQTLDEVRAQIQSQLLDQEKKAIWNAWLAKAKEQLHVVYKQGMEPTTTTTAAAGSGSTASSSSNGGATPTTATSQPTSTTKK